LLELIEARQLGLRAPLCFFPETSLAWAEKQEMTSKVLNAWSGEYNGFADSADPSVAMAWRGRDPMQMVELTELAGRIWLPLLKVATLVKAEDDRIAG
jgi:exonuclease V gamma subunit